MANIFEKIGNALEKGVPGLERVGGGIGDLIARNATLPTVPGMDLSPSQQRGLLSAQLRDRRIGQNVTRGNEDDFLNRIRSNNAIAGMQSGLQNLIEDPKLKAIAGGFTPQTAQTVGQSIFEMKTGSGGNLSGTPIYIRLADGSLGLAQLSKTGGLTMADGSGFFDNSPGGTHDGAKIIGNLGQDVDTQGEIAGARALASVEGETQGLMARYTSPEFANATLDFDILTKAPLEEELLRLRQQSAAGTLVDKNRIEKLTATLNDANNAFSRVEGKEAQQGLLNGLFEQARNQTGFWTTGFAGARLANLEGTGAYDLKETISAIRANVGFDKLQAMRDMSKTGGALGNVSNVEIKLLTDSLGSLDTAQSEDQFLEQLKRVEDQITESWGRVTDAFEQDYGISYYDPNARESLQDFLQGELDALVNPSDLRGRGADNPVGIDESLRLIQEERERRNAARGLN